MRTRLKNYKPRNLSLRKYAQQQNAITFNNYLDWLTSLALSIFKWENLPEGMNEMWLEYCLLIDGYAAFLYHENYGFINTQVTGQQRLNLYDIPTSIKCYGIMINETRYTYNGTAIPTNRKPEDYGVIIWNNILRTPTLPMIEFYATKLADSQRTADTNMTLHKIPYIMETDENTHLTMQNILREIDDNTIAVFKNKAGFNLDDIKVINTTIPLILDKLGEYKIAIFNEFLNRLGVNTLHEKKERLITDEANINNEATNLNLYASLRTRQLACDQFNKLFNRTGDKAIQVKVNSDLNNLIKSALSSFASYTDKITNNTTENTKVKS